MRILYFYGYPTYSLTRSESGGNITISDGIQAFTASLYIGLAIYFGGLLTPGVLHYVNSTCCCIRNRCVSCIFIFIVWATVTSGALFLGVVHKTFGTVAVNVGFYIHIPIMVILYLGLWLNDRYTLQRLKQSTARIDDSYGYWFGFVTFNWISYIHGYGWGLPLSNAFSALWLFIWVSTKRCIRFCKRTR